MEKNFRLAINITWGVTGVCLMAFLTMWWMSANGVDWSDRFFFLVFSIPLFMFCIILLPLLYSMRKKTLTGMAALEEGEYLARWHFEEDEWQRFHSIEWKKICKKSITAPAAMAVLFVVVGVFANGITAQEMINIVPWVLVGAAAISAIALTINYRTYKNNLRRPREVVVGLHGLSSGGVYATWEAIGTRLSDAKFVPGDVPVLEFTLKTWSRYGSRESALRVPVPRGHDQEAEELLKRFSSP